MGKEVIPVTINDSSQSLDLIKILRESLKLPIENGKLAVLITLLVVFPFSILILIHNHVAGPLLSKLEDQLVLNLSEVEKDIGVFLCLEAIYFFTFSIISLFGIIVTVYASSVAYTNYRSTTISLNDLFSKIRITWNKALVTWIYVWIFIFLYSLVVISIVIFALATKIGSISTWLYSILGCLAAILYMYLTIIWTLSLVITVLEQDCYGMKAIMKAREMMKGNEIQGFVLMLFLVLLTSPISIMFYLNGFDDEPSLMARLVLGLIVTGPFCVGRLFTFVVYTIFYYECLCKKKNGSVDDGEVELGNGYGLVLTDDVHVSD